jgi:glutamyl-tRNA reductase
LRPAPIASEAPVSRPLLDDDPEVTDIWALTADAGSLDAGARDRLAGALSATRSVEAGLLLITCHRVELYGRTPPPRFPAEANGARLRSGRDAIRHLLRVAAGLESAVVGEEQVLAQLRAAARESRRDGRGDPALARLVDTALAVGRRIRRGGRAREHGLAGRALAWLGPVLAERGQPSLLVVGAGPMGRAVAFSAARRGLEVTIATRTARRLASGLDAVDLERAAALAPSVDGIVVALGGPWEELAAGVATLPPIVDLSSPGALPTSVVDRPGLRSIDIDRLFREAPVDGDRTFAARAEAEVERAEAAFLTWLAARPAAPTVEALVERTARRTGRRVDRTLRRMPELDDRGRELVRQLATQVAADILHEPLAHLGRDGDGRARLSARELFDL